MDSAASKTVKKSHQLASKSLWGQNRILPLFARKIYAKSWEMMSDPGIVAKLDYN